MLVLLSLAKRKESVWTLIVLAVYILVNIPISIMAIVTFAASNIPAIIHASLFWNLVNSTLIVFSNIPNLIFISITSIIGVVEAAQKRKEPV